MNFEFKKFRKFIVAPHFKLGDRKTLMNLLFKNAYLTTFDFKDAYFLFLIAKRFRKYLRFGLHGRFYEFNCVFFL